MILSLSNRSRVVADFSVSGENKRRRSTSKWNGAWSGALKRHQSQGSYSGIDGRIMAKSGISLSEKTHLVMEALNNL